MHIDVINDYQPDVLRISKNWATYPPTPALAAMGHWDKIPEAELASGSPQLPRCVIWRGRCLQLARAAPRTRVLPCDWLRGMRLLQPLLLLLRD